MPTKDGYGINVVVPEDHSFTLDEEALRLMLLQEDVKDRAVVLVSVAGAYRKGKSFLLDFFLRYLDYTYNKGGEGPEWLGGSDEPLQGFKWRGGSDRETTGIVLWSQPFKATLANGEKVVILLMDTQGTFDSSSTVKDNATVFALSTMLSSLQIYNLSQNIEEDDLQHLQLFMDYGCVAKEKIEGKPFQRLQFLVRDWSYGYDHPYGAVGGQQLLEKRLKVKEDQHEELQKVRRDITRCFEQVECFLLPHPGLRVATDPHFNGKLSDIDSEFKKSLLQLAPLVLGPETLAPKVIDGGKVKARDLLNYFKNYVEVFNSEELPKPMTILEATADANNRSAMSEAREVYETLMEEVCGGSKPYLQPSRLEEENRRARDKALHAFESKKKMGGDEVAEKYREMLLKELEELYTQLSAHNEGKNVYRMLSTPLVLVAVIVLGYLLSTVGGALGVRLVDLAGDAVSIGATVMLVVWAYARVTGNLRDVGMKLDEVATSVRTLVETQAFAPRLSEPAAHSSVDKKDD